MEDHMLIKFKKPKKEKSQRKKDKLNIDAEAPSAGFAIGADDDDESLQRARKLALKMEDGTPDAIALLATSTNQNTDDAENGENRVVLTEMEEFVWSLQHQNIKEVKPATSSEQEQKGNVGGWAEVKDVSHDVKMPEKDVKPDETIRERSLGKGLSGALQRLKDQGTLKDAVDENDNDDKKEAFREFSRKFHGVMPGKKKLEKRMRQGDEELKVKKDGHAIIERVREALSKNQTPYLVLSGHVKPGYTSAKKRKT